MITARFTRLWAGALSLVGVVLTLEAAAAQPGSALPPFAEVYGLIRSNLAGATDESLNRAAVAGLLAQLQSQVSLETNSSQAADASAIPLVSKSAVFDGSYAFVRIGRVGPGLAREVTRAFDQISSSNKLKGLVLDLRFALGQDYAAAAETADLFFKSEEPLLQWGETTARSKAKPNAIDLPVVLLVNHDTTGAAEALAAALHQMDAAVIIGSPTAGQAYLFKEIPLSTGQVLRLASGQVSSGRGLKLPATGLPPDIRIAVDPQEEKLFFEDPYRTVSRPFAQTAKPATNDLLSLQSTNRSRRRLNEAELVRMQRDGMDLDAESLPSGGSQSQGPVITDPALARGLDLLKALALVVKRR